MLRDNLKPLEYFENQIANKERYIQENKEEIIELEEDIRNGIKRFPKDNESIIYGIYQTSAIYEIKKICALYSAGMPIEDLNQDFEYTIICMENYGEHKIGYLNLLWMISLGILLETDKKNIERLSKLVEKENIQDSVIDYLLYASDIGWTKIANIYYEENPYSKTKEIIELAQKDKNEAGWHESRSIELKDIELLYKSRNFEINERVRRFLEYYGMLEFHFPNKNPKFSEMRYINFNLIKALGKNLSKEGLDYLQSEYSEVLGEKSIFPVGETENRNMLLLISEDNQFYGYTDGCLIKYGSNVEEMLDCVIGEYTMPLFYD
jgi:hypothetical protein